MTKILYSGFRASELNQIHSCLRKHGQFQVVYVVTDNIDLLSADFNDSIKHGIHDSRNGVLPAGTSHTMSGPSSDALDQYLKSFKDIAVAIMGRQSETGWEFSFSEREHFFYILASYWSQVLKSYSIDLAISRNVPHFAAEYILGKICEYRNIPFIQTEDIWPLNRSFFISTVDSRSLTTCYYPNASVDCSNEVSNFIENNLADYGTAKPGYIVGAEALDRQAKGLKYLAIDLMRLMKYAIRAALCWTCRIRWIAKVSIKRNKRPIYSEDSLQTPLTLNLHRWKVRHLISRNKKIYSDLVGDIDLNQKYVLFAPNYQPERTTMPDGGDFYDMLYALGVLSSALPPDWKIVYKEHPVVFSWPGKVFFRGHIFRNEEYYSTLKLFDRVIFADSNYDTFKLIDNAEAVCSVTGTVLYQASIRGKKAVLFGNTWFGDCSLIHRYSSRSELYEFLISEQSDPSSSVDIWEEYLQKCCRHTFPMVDLLSPASDKEVYVHNLIKFMADRGFISRGKEA